VGVTPQVGVGVAVTVEELIGGGLFVEELESTEMDPRGTLVVEELDEDEDEVLVPVVGFLPILSRSILLHKFPDVEEGVSVLGG
jgi:hypothetical protein